MPLTFDGTTTAWMLGLGFTLLLFIIAVLALALSTRVTRLEDLQRTSGTYVDAEQEAEATRMLSQEADDARLHTAQLENAVQAFAVVFDGGASRAMQDVAYISAEQLRERLPVRCAADARLHQASCRYTLAHWFVVARQGGQGEALYDAVLAGRVRYVLIAGVVCRALRPEALPTAPSDQDAARLDALLAGRGLPRPRAGDDASGGASWARLLRSVDLRALILCPMDGAEVVSDSATDANGGGAACQLDLSYPVASGPAQQVVDLIASDTQQDVRALVLGW